MRIRQLRLEVQTDKGPFTTQLEFPDGLFVVWADNSMGKSTCVRSLLVALGMEAMLSTSQSSLPLTPALTEQITDSDGQTCAVLESDVYLEIENGSQERITIHRTIKGTRDPHLVTVISGPALSQSGESFATADYFVSRQGAASREAGFHRFLAGFLGWELPTVQTYEGGEYPLYLQCIFPYLVVEQTRGWSSIHPPVPTQLRIRDVHKRVVEFLLDMDAHKIALRRQELQEEKRRIESEWKSIKDRSADIADAVGGVVRNVPARPVINWPPRVVPNLFLSGGENWVTLMDVVDGQRVELAQIVEREIPRVQEIASVAEEELSSAERELRAKQATLTRRFSDIEAEESECDLLKHRIATLDEDIQRNKDVLTLQQLGSQTTTSTGSGECPVCHQSIQDTLVPLDGEQAVMSLDDNIQFLTEQRRTFQGVLANAEKVQEARKSRASTEREAVMQLRSRIRSLRQTLISDARLPSAAAIQARLELEHTIARNEAACDRFESLLEDFSVLAREWKDVQANLRALPKDDVTEYDLLKLRGWSDVLRSQLAQYEFKSLTIPPISISSDTYRPEHEGFDLQTSISASDLIRTIWSYLHGLLEVSRSQKTNHPGFVLFDEPRQQSARDESFKQLLKRASEAAGQQVILFTSEKRERLDAALEGVPHSLVVFEGRVLQSTSN